MRFVTCSAAALTCCLTILLLAIIMSALHELAKQIFRHYIIDNDEMDLLREAERLMQPIDGSWPDDERTLVAALAHARSSGQPVSSALWDLHGVNSHAENIWKDYYDLNRNRIEELVEELVDALQVEGYLFAPSTLDDVRSGDALVQSSLLSITSARAEADMDLSAVPRGRSESRDRGEVTVGANVVRTGVSPASTAVNPQVHAGATSVSGSPCLWPLSDLMLQKNATVDSNYNGASTEVPSHPDIGLRRSSRPRRPTKRSDEAVSFSAVIKPDSNTSTLFADSLPNKTPDRSSSRAQSSRRPRRAANTSAGHAVTLRDVEAIARFLAENPDTLSRLRDGQKGPQSLPVRATISGDKLGYS